MKNAILLAGGNGTRLQPFSKAINKSLLNLNGKAVVDYPLNTLKKMGVENVSIILGGDHFEQIVSYLEGGDRYGMTFNYVYQGDPKGIAHAISLCQRYVIDDNKFVVILGDNLYSKSIKWSANEKYGAQIVLDENQELQRFGVATVSDGHIIKIEEKPKVIDYDKQNYAISGCYLFDQQYFGFFDSTKPSARGEYEITEVIEQYREQGSLGYVINRGDWFDAGTHESMAKIGRYFHDKESK